MTKSLELIQQKSSFEFMASIDAKGQRIDKFISEQFPNYSRSFLQKLFINNYVTINNSKIAKPGYSLKIGDKISIQFIDENKTRTIKDVPQNVGVQIIAKEKDFLIIYKPAGLVVHPPHNDFENIALTDWLTKTYDDIAHVGAVDRPGIVHRLDRDTSGLMIITRTNQAHATLTDMFKKRTIHKTYLAIVTGHPPLQGSINFYIARHHSIRNKMQALTEFTKTQSSKEAISNYKVLQYYKDFSLVEIKPVTGRTHQIRVHFSALGHPLLSDHLYGSKSKLIKRQALHAHKIDFELNGKSYNFTSPLDCDMQKVIDNAEIIK